MPPVSHWRQLLVLMEESPPHAKVAMCKPASSPAPNTKELFALRALALTAGLANLLELHLLASAVCHQQNGNKQPPWPVPRLSLLVSAQDIPHSQWICFPIPVVQGNAARTVFCLLGVYAEKGETSMMQAPQFSADSKKAIKDAVTALARDCHIPPVALALLLLQDEKAPELTGSSLALPVALARYLLHHRQPWPKDLQATGAVYRDGQLQKVGGADKKFQDQDMKCLCLLPEGNIGTSPAGNAVYCASLREAVAAMQLHQLSIDPPTINRLREYCANPKNFLLHYQEIPTAALASEKCQAVLADISSHPARYLKHAADSLCRCADDPERARYLIGLYDPQTLQNLIDEAGEDGGTTTFLHSVFSWIAAVMAQANHRGHTQEAARWSPLRQQIDQYLREDDAYLCLLNHQFVGERFNCYRFLSEIPAEIGMLLDQEEARNAASYRASFQLGAIYGTLVQNFAFCGPAYFEQVKQYSRSAQGAFGHKYRAENKRLWLYQAYACLDRTAHAEASLLINQYFALPATGNASHWCHTLCRMFLKKDSSAPYAAALVFRAMADSQMTAASEVWQAVCEALEKSPDDRMHPWQLIYLNLGRLAITGNDPKAAKSLLQKALRVCCDGGETMRPMALLVLACLHRNRLASAEQYDQGRSILKEIRENQHLNQQHFQALYEYENFYDLLEFTESKREKLFPFMYR